ncbi:maleylpyruvate isomerase N-terminal domain-containing protein [Actinoalloteichus fjordicus]|uniref:maleylpyruvate isomerase N-terminal domain-containing protein n=1 Tax=Actinoalloteichus fjordicus TaxID=1612552 RepID=UPI000952F63F|nr:maleylpyruvate isomerase N-terminal domain-containing protein [Actinoalloteichus fjordicus]
MDTVFPQGQRREDLRVRDPDEPGWEAIVEIKGYTRGAQVNHLARIRRWASRYATDHGRAPDALWHVVNHFRTTDPSARPVVLPDDDALVDLVAEGGVLIDTRDLFTAARDVQAGTVAADVRKLLCGARGRWNHSEPPVADAGSHSPS